LGLGFEWLKLPDFFQVFVFFPLKLFNPILNRLNMQFELMLNSYMLSNISLKLPHDIFIDLWWSINTRKMAP
jgi:hypothetical protein